MYCTDKKGKQVKDGDGLYDGTWYWKYENNCLIRSGKIIHNVSRETVHTMILIGKYEEHLYKFS